MVAFAPEANQQFVLVVARPCRAESATPHPAAAIDALTGLANREAFVTGLKSIAMSSEPRELTVAFLDVDNFKTINDALGHDQGDTVLRTIAERLHQHLGHRALISRFGGDEFVVATSRPPEEDHAELRYLLGLVFAEPMALAGKQFQVSASIGIAATVDRQRMRPDAIIKAADIAMYEAKRQGKDRVAVYDESLEHQATARLELESDLRLAIERDEFILHYQPILDVISGRPVGAEALVRWIHPERGMIPPDKFIPVAEATGLIVPLGAWVLETALAQASQWNQHRLTRRALGISVNLSGAQLTHPDLERTIHAALSRTGFDPSRLTLEVTESVLMNDADDTMTILERLRAMGIGVAIDDFGTGYSSLAYLKRLPAKSLKVDKTFIDGLGTNPEDTALVTGILGLAGALGLEIVAEGVESELQLRELRRLGCEYSQGYYHSRPVPAGEFASWIEGQHPERTRSSAQLPDVPQAGIIEPAPLPPRIPTSFGPETAIRPIRESDAPATFFDQDEVG